ncbi:MAG: type IV pilus modification protein PilV [Gammaproteobacteria bacterium]
MSRSGTARPRHAGFSLLEVLVALLVFTIGLLGATALSVEGFRLEQRALLRAEIAMLGADLAGRMRSNAAGRPGYQGLPASRGCASAMQPAMVCTPLDLASDDLMEVTSRLRRLTSSARLTVDLGDPDSALITIRWHDTGGDQRYQLEVAS